MKNLLKRKIIVTLTFLIISESTLGFSNISSNTSKQAAKKLPIKVSTLPGTLEVMNDKSYWIEKLKQPKAVIMTNNQINKFNNEIIERVPMVYNLRNYKNSLSKKELISFISSFNIPKKMMYNKAGITLTHYFYNELELNRNIQSIKKDNSVFFGLIVKKTNLRAFPTDESVYDSNSLRKIDRFQESSAEPCTPVIILHTSSDGKWFFIQMYNYRAWVKAEDVAVSKDKKTVIDYVSSKNFLIVTGNHIKSQLNPNDKSMPQIEFAMGTKIPMSDNVIQNGENKSVSGDYVVMLPYRNGKGQLEFRNALIADKEDVNIGFLPYTRENILIEAFKLLGDRYDWGNKYDGRDCSGFVISIYNTFGIMLPRNTYEQEKSAGIIYNFKSGDSIEKRNEVLDKVKPGAVIFMDGHEMLYLGMVAGVHYIIHDFTGYGVKNSSGYRFHSVYEVAVTSTLLPLSSGIPFIKKFTSVLQLE